MELSMQRMTKSKNKMDTVVTEPVRKRKSVVLTKQEMSELKKYKKSFNTITECAISIGIDRNVLDRVLLAGSGAPESIEKVKAALDRGLS
jgi:hypothetical protein